ncbi:MAG: tetratricopeptide repeat protein [Cyanobacteria bacterium P01_C01_bin.72]
MCLLGLMGLGSIGFNLVNRHRQIQQIQRTQTANDLLKQKKYALAVAAYDELLQTSTAQLHRLWTNRGYALLELDHHQEALNSCSQATSLNPQADLAWNCRGEALYYLGQQQQALTVLEKAIAIQPENEIYWFNYSNILANLSDHEAAVAASEKAISLLQSQPQTDTTKSNLAHLLGQQGHILLELEQNKQALTAFEQSLDYQPDSLTAQQGKGIALYRLGRYAQAIKLFTRILRREDLTTAQRAISLLYQGISLCETPQAAAATKAFEQVLQLTADPQLQKIAASGCGIR